MKKRILITGGRGYLGSRLTAYLESVGASPILLPRVWETLPENIDGIVHLAAANEIASAKDPVGTIHQTARDISQLLKSTLPGTRVVYLSTAHVYGSPLAGNVDERVIPRPSHPYAIAKRMGEDLILSAHSQSKIEGLVFRLSNGIGYPAHSEHDRWTLIGNDLCRQTVTDRKMILKSSGKQLRDFIPMGDVLRAVYHALTMPKEAVGDGLYNLGGDRTMSILEMARFIASRCEKTLGFLPELIVPKNSDPDPVPFRYDITKWKQTGFRLETSLESEIDGTLAFCRGAR